MNWVALFPGQGSQHQKMGLDLFEEHQETLNSIVDKMDDNSFNNVKDFLRG